MTPVNLLMLGLLSLITSLLLTKDDHYSNIALKIGMVSLRKNLVLSPSASCAHFLLILILFLPFGKMNHPLKSGKLQSSLKMPIQKKAQKRDLKNSQKSSHVRPLLQSILSSPKRRIKLVSGTAHGHL